MRRFWIANQGGNSVLGIGLEILLSFVGANLMHVSVFMHVSTATHISYTHTLLPRVLVQHFIFAEDENPCTMLCLPSSLSASDILQAEDLGKLFRTVMYPRYGPAGNGFLRLHSTYRHDLKIYTSDEGRVQTSAAAFTQGLLDLEGTSLTPILVR